MCARSPRQRMTISQSAPQTLRRSIVRTDDLFEHLALLFGAIAAVERLGLDLLAVDLDVAGADETFLFAERGRDRVVVALAAIVAVELLAGEQPVAAHRQRRLV